VTQVHQRPQLVSAPPDGIGNNRWKPGVQGLVAGAFSADLLGAFGASL
jgi:hypothetical protein